MIEIRNNTDYTTAITSGSIPDPPERLPGKHIYLSQANFIKLPKKNGGRKEREAKEEETLMSLFLW